MLCTRCTTTAPSSTVAGTCNNASCGKYTSHKTYMICRDCSRRSGRCEACRQLVVSSGATAPGTVKPLGDK